MRTQDIGWVAGILEGEGWMGTIHTLGKGNKYHYPGIQLVMTDPDIVHRFAGLVGGKVREYPSRGPKLKATAVWRCSGSRAAGIMMTVLPLLGERRGAAVRAALDDWRTHPTGRR